jgi:hypothetical protein
MPKHKSHINQSGIKISPAIFDNTAPISAPAALLWSDFPVSEHTLNWTSVA